MLTSGTWTGIQDYNSVCAGQTGAVITSEVPADPCTEETPIDLGEVNGNAAFFVYDACGDDAEFRVVVGNALAAAV